MAINKKEFKNFRFQFFLTTLVLIVLPFFFFQSSKEIILFFLFILFSYFTSFIFWISFIPNLPKGFPEILVSAKTILQFSMQKGISIYSVRNGDLSKDYFEIKNKPKILALFIEDDSTVVVEDLHGKKRLLFTGFNFLQDNEKIVHTYNLNFNNFTWGPKTDQNPFVRRHPTDHVSRTRSQLLRRKQTISMTKDGISVAASFSVFYNFNAVNCKKAEKDTLLAISDFYTSRDLQGNLDKEIEETIGTFITKKWQEFVRTKNLNEIISNKGENSNLTHNFVSEINPQSFGNLVNEYQQKERKNTSAVQFQMQIMRLLNVKIFLNKIWVDKNDF